MLAVPKAECLDRKHLFSSISPEERVRLCSHARTVALAVGDVINRGGERLTHGYFPTSSVISHLYTTHDGLTASMALTGSEGIVGLGLFLGGTSPHVDAVQIAGTALTIPAKILREEFALGGRFQQIVLRYTQSFITQVAQSAVCNRLHSLEQRLCRWLLACHDRVDQSEIMMTQEAIANMVGGRRESVTVSAGRLQDMGLIRYSRGHIQIVDRAAIEAMVCECYGIVAGESDRITDVIEHRNSKWGLLSREVDSARL